jgi:DNA repair ATPase RecN
VVLQITRLSTSDGHLRDVPVELSPGLNCIIGARGTCKSTIVETIRFLFDNDQTRVAELLDSSTNKDGPGHRGLIEATLRGGTAQLRLHVDSGGAEEAVIERDASSERPALYRDGVIVVDDPELLSEIEIYSQGELQEIATDAAKRLALVDRPHQSEIDGWRQQIGEISTQVAAIGPQLREIAEAIEAAEAGLAEGQPLKEQLEQLQAEHPEMSTEVSQLRAAHQEREARLERGTAILDRYRANAEAMQRLAEELANTAEDAADLRDSGSAELEEIEARLRASAVAGGEFSSSLADPSQLEELLGRAVDAAAAESQPYYEALREEEAVTDKLKQEDRLAEEVKKLDRIKEGLERNRAGRDELRAEREQLRAKLRELRAKIFEMRLAEVERINANFSEKIVLALRQGTQTKRYGSRLESLLEGSRLRDRPRLCAELAAAFPPDALVEAVEAEDSTTLAQALDRDAGQMVRLVAHLGGSERIFSLESEVPDVRGRQGTVGF